MYKVLRTNKAEDQLRDIIYYIADDSLSIDIALKYLHKIEEAISCLQDFPNSGSIPRYSILVDGRREYKNLI